MKHEISHGRPRCNASMHRGCNRRAEAAEEGRGGKSSQRRRDENRGEKAARSSKRASLVVAQEVDVKLGTASDRPAASSRVTKALGSSSLTYTDLLLAAAFYREHAGLLHTRDACVRSIETGEDAA